MSRFSAPSSLLLSLASAAAIGAGGPPSETETDPTKPLTDAPGDGDPSESESKPKEESGSLITTGADLKAVSRQLWIKTTSAKQLRFVDLVRQCVTPDLIGGEYRIGGKATRDLAEAREMAQTHLMEVLNETIDLGVAIADAHPDANTAFDGPGGTILNVTGRRMIALLLGEDDALRKSVDKTFKAMAKG